MVKGGGRGEEPLREMKTFEKSESLLPNNYALSKTLSMSVLTVLSKFSFRVKAALVCWMKRVNIPICKVEERRTERRQNTNSSGSKGEGRERERAENSRFLLLEGEGE